MYMFKYVMKRIGLMLLTFIIIMSICFILVKLLPVPNEIAFGSDSELIKIRREKLGYGKPILEQLFIYARSVIVYGDWGIGEQMYRGQEVVDVFLRKLPATMLVNLYAVIFSVPIGLALGIFTALKKNKWQDHVISTLVMLFISVPSFVYAFLVQYFFCFKLGWFPFLMEASTNYFAWSMFVSIIPPIMSLAFGTVARFTRSTRAELTEVLTSEFMLLARTKGLTKSQATVRHALRNSMVPIFPMILGEFISILAGSLVIERIFTIPGVGGLYVDAINNLDYNFFLLDTAFYTIIGLASGILVDISYGIIDPRIRMGAR